MLKTTYADVPSGEWYYPAVAWAQSKKLDEGIVNGSVFSPNASITREEFVRVLYNLAGKPNVNSSSLDGFTDVNQISSFAKEAFAWAVDKGIITGTSATTLSPTATLERSQAATMVIRYLRYIDYLL